jgi:hypothetical protein
MKIGMLGAGDLKVGGRMQQAKTAPLAGPDFLLPD